jgi:hypothetical protein
MRADYLNDNSGKSNFNNKVIIASADITLSADQSGSFISLNSNGIDVTLPSPESGMNFKFVLNADYSTAVCTIVQAGASDDFVGSLYGSSQGESAATDADVASASDTKITFAANGKAGDSVDLISDGTKWYVKAFATVYDAITFD